MAAKKVRAQLIELYSRVISISDKKDSIYTNGDDNLYPYEIDRAINNSPTATRAAYIMSKFISGNGVEQDVLVNTKKGLMLSDVVDLVAEDASKQHGSFIWVGYGLNESGDISGKTLDVFDYSNCRESKEDDNDYKGKIYVKDYSTQRKGFVFRNDADDKKWYYPYNPDKAIVKAQMLADARLKLDRAVGEEITIDEMVRCYRGQVFHLNFTPRYKYALSKFDSVYNDMDSEYRFSLYVNTQMREGFLGKTVVVTQGLDEEYEEVVKADLAKWLGAENTGNMYHLSVEQAESLANVIRIDQLKPQMDDKLFVENDKRIRRNILGAANNLPEPLIYASEGALFGTSADAYTEMKLFYQEQTEKERDKIEKTLTRLGFPTVIKPIISINNGITNPTE